MFHGVYSPRAEYYLVYARVFAVQRTLRPHLSHPKTIPLGDSSLLLYPYRRHSYILSWSSQRVPYSHAMGLGNRFLKRVVKNDAMKVGEYFSEQNSF